jgi:hypothetical protein
VDTGSLAALRASQRADKDMRQQSMARAPNRAIFPKRPAGAIG